MGLEVYKYDLWSATKSPRNKTWLCIELFYSVYISNKCRTLWDLYARYDANRNHNHAQQHTSHADGYFNRLCCIKAFYSVPYGFIDSIPVGWWVNCGWLPLLCVCIYLFSVNFSVCLSGDMAISIIYLGGWWLHWVLLIKSSVAGGGRKWSPWSCWQMICLWGQWCAEIECVS